MANFSIAVHGGAGTIERSALTPELEQAYLKGLEEALDRGYDVLSKGGSALDAATVAAVSLEDHVLFNAGRGSVFTRTGTHEMDASVMNGAEGSAGAVAGISQIRNPVLLARAVMDKSNHVLLCSEGAMAFARENGFSLEPDEYFYSAFRYRQWQEIRQTDQVRLDHAGSDQGARHESGKMGTIGAVARDCYGHLAAATSTGGMTNKRPGRVGDSPLIGCGTWASDETCAISCTGHGELFIRTVAAYDVHARMAYAGLSLDEAMRQTVMERLVQAGAEGGMIGADRSGNIVMYFNSEGMYRGMRDSDGRRMTAIYR